ncbi:MAG TPA: DUF3231 family protein [Bacillus sp. (in: firmicutes)]|uniref:DUF3231 family protein n=1 Tax=Bacillus litorisediminis TaxID=2922713 RepID=UPI001FB00FDC|nr:DUF3231 family protein [Bacillus litorisediminis]HWO75183.1 DUF3231 family protein [Bacillus sp. (in: firmicutes)]
MSLEQDGKVIKLTAAEISQLWSAYMNDSASICQLTYFLEKAEDQEIRTVIEQALRLAQSHIDKLTEIMNKENFPIPYGFKLEEDVDVTAPRLFSDCYVLTYLSQMGKIGLSAYSLGVSLADRSDVYSYFAECLKESTDLHRQANEVLLPKGLYIRSPYLEIPENIDFVKKQSFLSGYFDKRTLTALEITNLFANFERNALGNATLIGYSQVAKSDEVRKYFKRGKEIAKKHCHIFGTILRNEDLPAPTTWDTEVSDSTAYTFSDKLMMFYTTALISLSIGYYGASVAGSPRRDIGTKYADLTRDILLYAEDGVNIMIKNGWLEEPPRALDRDELAKKK